jgi:hypothetical protein
MQTSLLQEWNETLGQLSTLKAKEMSLRKQLVATVFPEVVEGTQTLQLNNGWKLVMTQPFTRSLDQAKVPALLKELKKLQAAPTLIKIKYELSIGEFRKLEGEGLLLVQDILTTKPGAPSLELVAPKGETV